MFYCFKGQAKITIFNISSSIYFKAQPILFFVNEVFYIIDMEITC